MSGSIKTPLYSKTLDESDFNSGNFQLSPVIIQQKIHGDTHYRVNVFGDDIISYKIVNEKLDWRRNIGEVTEVTLDQELQTICKKFISRCELKMGILDFKIDKSGMIFFLENNPQGQFLFLQPYSKIRLAERFADFLLKA